MTIHFKFTRKEIEDRLPYRLICETVCGSKWETGKRKRLEKEWFNNEESKKIPTVISQSKKWNLRTGIPMEGVSMSADMYDLWQKVGRFCAEL